MTGKEPLVLTGLPHRFADADLSASYGPSWAAAVDFLTEKHGTEILEGIYDQIRAGVRPVDALLTRLPDPEYDWWPDFVDRYVRGTYFGVESSLFISRIPGESTFLVQSASDSTDFFHDSHEQLSAKLYRVRFDYSDFDDNASLRLQLDTGSLEPEWAVLQVYRAKDGVLTHLGQGNEFTVSGIKELALGGHDVIPVIANCYTNQPYDETVRMRLDARIVEPLTGFTRRSIDAAVIATFREGADPPEDELWFASFHAIGEMVDGTFTGDLDPDHHPAGMTGSVTVRLDPVSKAVLSFHGMGSATGSEGSSTWSVSGAGVPKVEESGEPVRYFENGPETCTYVTGMTYLWTPNSGDARTLTEFTCGENSEVRIRLSES